MVDRPLQLSKAMMQDGPPERSRSQSACYAVSMAVEERRFGTVGYPVRMAFTLNEPNDRLSAGLELEQKKWRSLANETVIRDAVDLRSLSKSFEDILQYRKHLARDVPELLSAIELDRLREKMSNYLREAAGAVVEARLERNHRGGALLNKKIAQDLQQELDNKFNIMRLEGRIAMNRSVPQQIVIGNVNLGTVIGNLNATINTLSAVGQTNLADALKDLGQAIAASETISDKKDKIENLSFVSEQALLPAEQRKPSTMRAAWNAIKTGIEPATNLFGLAVKVEEALRGIGILN